MSGYDFSQWKEGNRPPKNQTVSAWIGENVFLPDSPIGAKFDPDAARYCIDILEEYRNPETYEINVVGCTGMGKTAIFEGVHAWIIGQAPGPTLTIGATNNTVKDWVKSRLMKVLEACDATKQFLPRGTKRNDKTNDSIIFRHMSLFMGGANKTNTQEKSMQYTHGDEPWEWDFGIIKELLARHHDRWNRKNLLQSQGGKKGSEWHQHSKHGKQMRRHFICPECKEPHEWKWDLMKYDTIKTEGDEYDWLAIEDTVRMECPCGAEFKDTPNNRRALADSGVWVAEPGKHVPGRITYNVPFFWVWRIRWSKVVQEWILAQDQKRAGNNDPLEQFINKRLADWWEEPSDVPELRTDGDPYSRKEFEEGEKWEGEDFRFMTVDVQKNYFWYVIRVWKVGGASRMIKCGKAETWENLRFLQEKFSVPNKGVFIDCGYLPDEVAEKRMLHRNEIGKTSKGDPVFEYWNMLMGEDSQGYHVKIRKTDFWRTYSNYVNRSSQKRVPYRFIKYSNLRAKDQLAALMSGKGEVFGVPVDHGKAYAVQMANEQKKEVSAGKWRWVPVTSKANNHLWDCEVMGIVAACIYKVLSGVTQKGD